MSFSGEVREELALRMGEGRHCQIAEIMAIITMCGGVSVSSQDKCSLRIHTENRYVAFKYAALLWEAFSIRPESGVRLYARSSIYCVAVLRHEQAVEILRACHLMQGSLSFSLMDIIEELPLSDNPVLKRTCCRRAFLRGAFLCAGSISDPRRFNHFEIVCASYEKARQVQDTAASFGLEGRIVERKQYQVFYLKEGTQIVDALGVMEATKALMKMENIRILREISNDINRRVNCETANISKSVAAGVRQAEEIRYISGHGGLEQLPKGLRTLARLRLEYMDLSLQELGQQLEPPLGKSGVNHRFEKISQFARQLRSREEGMEEP